MFFCRYEVILMSIFIVYFSYFQDFFHCAVIMTDGNGKYIIATFGIAKKDCVICLY